MLYGNNLIVTHIDGVSCEHDARHQVNTGLFGSAVTFQEQHCARKIFDHVYMYTKEHDKSYYVQPGKPHDHVNLWCGVRIVNQQGITNVEVNDEHGSECLTLETTSDNNDVIAWSRKPRLLFQQRFNNFSIKVTLDSSVTVLPEKLNLVLTFAALNQEWRDKLSDDCCLWRYVEVQYVQAPVISVKSIL